LRKKKRRYYIKKKGNKVKNISDKQGRALEYIIVEEITNKMPQNKAELTKSARLDQDREKAKFEACSSMLQNSYKKVAEIVFEWLKNNFQIDMHRIIGSVRYLV